MIPAPQVEALQAEVCSLDGEVELLRSQLQAITLERNGKAQEVAGQHRELRDAQQKVCLGGGCHGDVVLCQAGCHGNVAHCSSFTAG